MSKSPEQRREEILDRASGHGLSRKTATLSDGTQVPMTYQAEFRWRWFATRLHVFTFVAAMDHVGKQDIREFARLCTDFAKKEKPGLPRGFQTGAAAVPIVVASEVDDEATSWVETGVKNRFALLTFPALVDAGSGEVLTVRKIRAWGMIYDAFLRHVVRQHAGASERLLVPPSEKRSAIGKLLAISLAIGGVVMALMVGWALYLVWRLQ